MSKLLLNTLLFTTLLIFGFSTQATEKGLNRRMNNFNFKAESFEGLMIQKEIEKISKYE